MIGKSLPPPTKFVLFQNNKFKNFRELINIDFSKIEQNPDNSTRAASGTILNYFASTLENMIVASADLSNSDKTDGFLKASKILKKGDFSGAFLQVGVAELTMAAIANGMALHGGVIPVCGTFFVFSDYMKPAVRLAALMGIRAIYIFTHDSIGMGEDGPTHQPIEQLMGLREVPNLVTIRPADASETTEAWKTAMERRDGPTALILSRQNLPVLNRTESASASGVQRGAYILWEASTSPDVIVIGTGSEVHIALGAGKILEENGIKARVVSMPSWELFDSQPLDYRNEVLPPAIRVRVSIEAGTPLGWERYVGLDGITIGIPRFGASAPGSIVYEKLGFNVDNVVARTLKLLEG